MSKRQILMVIGVWVMVLCGNGFPDDIQRILGIVTGALVIFIAYKIRPDKASPRRSAEEALPYIENRNE